MINNKIAVHLRAPVLSASGYGVHSRQVMEYLLSDERFIVFLENVGWGNCPFVHEYDFEDKDRIKKYYGAMANYDQAMQQNIPFDLSIQVTIPNEFSKRAQFNVGVTAGIEVDHCTIQWIKKCNEMDLIVVPSKFSAEVLSQTVYNIKDNRTGNSFEERLRKPVFVIPEYFEHPKTIVEPKFKFSTSKNLLFVGLWGNKGGFGEDRKNVSDLIRMFLTHFGDNPDYGLVLKTSIITNSPEDFHHTKDKILQIKANFPKAKAKIHLIHEYLNEAEMHSLYNHPQILGMISLTHGEGWGLPLLEAASNGMPILATKWSGHLDFLREKHGYIPLDYEMKDIPDCQVWEGVIDKGSKWACVDEDDFKKKVKKFLESSFPVKKLAKENVSWLQENFSKDAVFSRWRQFFDSFIKPINSNIDDVSDPAILQELAYQNQVQDQVKNLAEKLKVEQSENKKVLFCMPRSFGDVLISTSVANSLLVNRHGDDDFYFATSPEYAEVLNGLKEKYSNFHVVDWDDRMMQTDIVKHLFDYVYNPTVNVQYTVSNWTLGNGEFGVRLLEEFAKHCNIAPYEVQPYVLAMDKCTLPKKQYVAITAVSSKQAKEYKYWNDVVHNLKKMADVEVVQLGMKSEKLIDGCLDYRGKSFNETLYVLSRSILHISPDTGTAHACGALSVPHIVLFGTTSPYQCCPVFFDNRTKQIVVDSAAAKEPRSYRDVDTNIVDGKNTISHISPKTVCSLAFDVLKGIKSGETYLPILRMDKLALDDKIDAWHDSPNPEPALHEYLGLTQDQYQKFVKGSVEDLNGK